MHKDFFLNLISQVQSPLQTADREERDKPRNTEITDMESMLSGCLDWVRMLKVMDQQELWIWVILRCPKQLQNQVLIIWRSVSF
jgi:hypothetical protein